MTIPSDHERHAHYAITRALALPTGGRWDTTSPYALAYLPRHAAAGNDLPFLVNSPAMDWVDQDLLIIELQQAYLSTVDIGGAGEAAILARHALPHFSPNE